MNYNFIKFEKIKKMSQKEASFNKRFFSLFCFNTLFLSLFIVAIGVFMIGMPKYSDDLWYMFNLRDWFYEQNIYNFTLGGNILKYGIPWTDIFKTWHDHWLTDNIRIGNLLVIFFLLLPKWVGSGFALLILIYSIIECFRIADINFRKSPLVLLGILIFGICLPWWDRMGSMDYQFNYVLSTGVGLWFLSRLKINNGTGKQTKIGGITCIITFLVGFLAGAWHEGFSIPIMIGVIFLLFMYKSCRNKNFYWGLSGIVIGIALISFTPGTFYRLSLFYNPSIDSLDDKLRYIILYNLIFYLFLVVCMLFILRKGIKLFLKDKLLTFCVINGLIPIIILTIIYNVPRITWWTQIVSLIGLIHILNIEWPIYWKRYKSTNLIFLIPLYILMLCHFVWCDLYVIKMRNTFIKGIEDYIAFPDKTVFGEVITLKNQEPICYKLPDALFFGIYLGQTGTILYPFVGKNDFKIIPKELKFTEASSGRLIKGGLGIREFNGRLIVEENKTSFPEFDLVKLKADYGKGYMEVFAYSYKFKSEADGKDYRYIHLMSPWYLQQFGELRSLKLY